jgi:hypothetical protein
MISIKDAAIACQSLLGKVQRRRGKTRMITAHGREISVNLF